MSIFLHFHCFYKSSAGISKAEYSASMSCTLILDPASECTIIMEVVEGRPLSGGSDIGVVIDGHPDSLLGFIAWRTCILKFLKF
jgi:hypothetical protein